MFSCILWTFLKILGSRFNAMSMGLRWEGRTGKRSLTVRKHGFTPIIMYIGGHVILAYDMKPINECNLKNKKKKTAFSSK